MLYENGIMHFICTGAPYNSRCECMTNKSEGCPNNELFYKIIKNNNFIGKLFEELCWENCPTIHVEGPMNCFGELPNKFTSKDCPTYLYRRVAYN